MIEQRLQALAEVSEPGPGVTRPAFGTSEREAHALVATWAAQDGARVETDGAGNTVLVYREGEPYLLVGSRLDTVPAGGRYDGTVGVVAGMQVAGEVAGRLGLGLRVVAFSAEEGARFGRPCLGSELATGAGDRALLEALHDADGATAAAVAEATGLDPGAATPWLRSPDVAAYLEIHIEQGRVLEREQVRLGVVDVIAGAARLEVTLHGEAAHSGTTPMDDRADALAAAAELVLAVEAIGREGRHGVATIGRLDVTPNSTTTVPGAVRAVVDVRDVDAGRQRATLRDVRAVVKEIAEGRHVRAEVRELAERDPVMLSSWPRRALADACTQLGLAFRILASGAGHDAAVVALAAPAAMLFVPSLGGRSHVPDERCRIDDVAAACAVLGEALRRLDHDARGGD